MSEITQVTISIDTVNASFYGDAYDDAPREDGDVFDEVERILAGILRYGMYHDMPLRDYNGNAVGVVTITRSES